MRGRKLIALVVAVIMLGACVQNPDPREISIEMMQREGHGGWIVIEHRDGILQGELLAIDDATVYVNDVTRNQTLSVPIRAILKAELFRYESDAGFGAWGVLGSLSTISHGFFLIFTFPIWVLTSSIAATAESRHVRDQYPEGDISEFSKWARYPQGMPKKSVDHREQAWQLTQEAAKAARDGNCERVKELALQVEKLDRGSYEVVFSRDVAIRACFGVDAQAHPDVTPPGATPPTPVPPTPPTPTPTP